MGRPLWQVDGSVINSYSCFWPCQSSHSRVQVQQNSRPYFTVSYETLPTWRARSLHLYLPGSRWPSYTPRALGSLFVASNDSQSYDGGILTRLHAGYANVKWVEVFKFTIGIRILKPRLLTVVAHTKLFTYKGWSGLNNKVRCSSHGFNNLPKKEDNGANWIPTWYVDQIRPCSTHRGDRNIRISTDENSRISQQFTEPEGSLMCSQQPLLVVIQNQSNPVHTAPSDLSNILFYIILPPQEWIQFIEISYI
jgi:hypothetical protein